MTVSDIIRLPSISAHFDVDRLARSLDEQDEPLRRAFVTYVLEALFFDSVLDDDLDDLTRTACILEVGAGIGLLAMLTALRGFTVTAYEPESDGFSHMRRIRNILTDCWTGPELDVDFIDGYFTGNHGEKPGFGFAYAIHVIEHVPEPQDLILAVTSSLAPNGRARFICPNYAFPYEPHFGIPTLWNKNLTKVVFRRAISHSHIGKVEEFWDDLSWPSVRTLKRSFRTSKVNASFGRRAMLDYVYRLRTDVGFVERKGAFFKFARAALTPVISVGAKFMPVQFLPIIDVTTRRTSRT